jgi:benzaldehyde dehydrogenase (NAD)
MKYKNEREGAVMAVMDESVWRGKIYSGGARFGGTANLEAFTDTRWVTIRGDIAPYPF